MSGAASPKSTLIAPTPRRRRPAIFSRYQLHGVGVREVQDGVFVGKPALAVADEEALLQDLGEETVLGHEVRELPERDVEALALEVRDHLRGVLEARLGELVVGAPVRLEPARVEVDDVARDAALAQLRRHRPRLVLGEVGDPAHPEAERPQRRHGRLARQLGVFVEDVLGRSQEHEQVHLVVAQEERVAGLVARAHVEGGGGRSCARTSRSRGCS